MDSGIFFPILSIQPIVENAVSHGILKQPKGGTVTIQLKVYDTYNEIAIIDNGVGMDEETIQTMLNAQPGTVEGAGIGVTNTNRRLKKLFARGLPITSTLQKGSR